jgi:crotonobetainyl-CoA:carnitine CoA-transferase CaiB-like acyl-CoA transferase
VLPLTGVRLADSSGVLAGPYATMTLAGFGADVITIESPSGDDTRAGAPPRDRLRRRDRELRARRMERSGRGHDDLRQPNPGVVYCSTTGFGAAAGAMPPGYDLLARVVDSLMCVTGGTEPAGVPVS